jgi:hypothetical protein
MIRNLSSEDMHTTYAVINEASRAYRGIIPDDCYHEPYMPKEELYREMKSMTFVGWDEQLTSTNRLLVGTWADASWAIDFYQERGFKLMPDKNELLLRYWDIPRRQVETSLALGMEM